MRSAVIVVLLGLLFPGMAKAMANNGYLGEVMLPVVVDSATYQSSIYVDAMFTSEPGVSFRVTYYGGNDTPAPGQMDCGQHGIATAGTRKFGLRDLCPGLPPGSHYGALSFSTLGIAAGPMFIPRIRVYARVQNFQGIGFSVEGIPPADTEEESRVIGVKSGVDAAGIRYQTNCFVGQHSENQVQDPVRTNPGSVMLILEGRNGIQMGNVSITVANGRLYRVLDLFSAVGVSNIFHDAVTVRFRSNADNEPMPFFGFCTVQENRNFSADFRVPVPGLNEFSRFAEVIQWDGNYSPYIALAGSEVARFRPSGLSADTIHCTVGDPRLWIRVTGYFDPASPPQVSETGRIRLKNGLPYGSNEVEVGLKDGEVYGTGYVVCYSGNGIGSLVRVL